MCSTCICQHTQVLPDLLELFTILYIGLLCASKCYKSKFIKMFFCAGFFCMRLSMVTNKQQSQSIEVSSAYYLLYRVKREIFGTQSDYQLLFLHHITRYC